MPVLVVSASGRPDEVVLLGDDALVVGRAESCDVRIEDPKASGQHLRLAPFEGGWLLQDLGSTRGVRVGKRRVQRAVLALGDTLMVGETRIRFLTQAPDPRGRGRGAPGAGPARWWAGHWASRPSTAMPRGRRPPRPRRLLPHRLRRRPHPWRRRPPS